MNTSAIVCLLLTIPRDAEEALVDWLLTQSVPGFTGYAVEGHSGGGPDLGLAEQVSGRRRGYQFRVELPLDSARRLLAQLRHDFAGARIRYTLLPVIESGSMRH